ncbi:MAG: non-homologous end-joining DNA ligase [Micromonosporaceae bacterium]
MPGVPIRPMLATAGVLPVGDDWAYEFKWDGVRAIAALAEGRVRLYARSGAEITAAYPELAPLGKELPDAVLDGEMVAFDAAGRPSFERLAERMHVRDPANAARLAVTTPVMYVIFDLLRLDGLELIAAPYRDRRAALDELELAGPHWQVSPMFDDGLATADASAEFGLEGVMAKRLSSVYRPGARTNDWVKVKQVSSIDLVVGGWRPGERPLGALLAGEPQPDGSLRFRARVGGGLADKMIRELLSQLEPLRRQENPFGGSIPREDARGAVWVEPRVVVEIAYGNETSVGRLRFPRFLRLRPDLSVEDLRGGTGAEK